MAHLQFADYICQHLSPTIGGNNITDHKNKQESKTPDDKNLLDNNQHFFKKLKSCG